MKVVRQILAMALLAMVLTVSGLSQEMAVAQKRNDNRPPKEKPKIKEQPKPPPSNNNQGNSNRRGRP